MMTTQGRTSVSVVIGNLYVELIGGVYDMIGAKPERDVKSKLN
jgi:hypothetical protein